MMRQNEIHGEYVFSRMPSGNVRITARPPIASANAYVDYGPAGERLRGVFAVSEATRDAAVRWLTGKSKALYTFRPTGERRPPKKGEWFTWDGGPSMFSCAAVDFESDFDRDIYTLESEPIEVEEPVPEWCYRSASTAFAAMPTDATGRARMIHKCYLAAKERGEA